MRVFVVAWVAAPWLVVLGLGLGVLAAHAADPGRQPGQVQLQELLDASHAHHPGLRAALSSASAARVEVGAAKRQRWPSVSLQVESDSGQNTAPASGVVRVEQTLWDFGLVGARIGQTERAADAAALQARVQGQEVHLQVIAAWQTARSAVLRIHIAQNALTRLQGYADQMRRRVEAAASSAIDQDLVNARVLQVRAELALAESALRTTAMRLEEMTGVKGLHPRLMAMPPPMDAPTAKLALNRLDDTDWSAVSATHVMTQQAQQDRSAAERQLSAKQSEQYPQLYMRWEKPLNPSPLSTNQGDSWFVGIRYAPGAGFSTSAEASALAVRLQAQDHALQAVEMEVRQQFLADHEDLKQSFGRLSPLYESVLGAERVMESYVRQFQAGRKSWLDLLNAAREMSQSQYAYAEVQAGFEAAWSRLQVRLSNTKVIPHE